MYIQDSTDQIDHFDRQTRCCRNLCAAVLGSAIHDLKRGLKYPNPDSLRLRDLAINWFWAFAESRMSFLSLCAAIDYCPIQTRNELIEQGLLPTENDARLRLKPNPASIVN